MLIMTLFASCHNAELKELRSENAELKTELDSLKTIINEEKEKRNFLGKYVNKENGLYKSFDFKGESSVVLTDGIFGFPFATSYERDGQIIRVRTDKSDLMLTVKDKTTLIGEGFAEGTYLKKD